MIKIALVIKVTDFGFYFWRENSDNLSGFDTLLIFWWDYFDNLRGNLKILKGHLVRKASLLWRPISFTFFLFEMKIW